MTVLRLSLLSLCLMLLAMPAHAVEINKTGAAKLKQIVQDYITEQQKIAGLNSARKIDYQGDVMVEEAGDYYAITLPYAKVIYPDGAKIDIGMISINASESEIPGQWKMRVAVPTPIIMTDASGGEMRRITLGGQRAAGIWDETLKSFIKLDAMYKDILIAGGDDTYKIAETNILYDFAKDAAGKWSGPGSVTFKNPEGNSPQGGFRADQVKAEFNLDQYNAPAINAYRQKMAGLGETIAKSGGKPADHANTIIVTLLDFLIAAGDGMNIRYDATGLQLSRPTTAGVQTINIPNGFFGIGLDGLNSGKMRFSLKAGSKGVSITPATPENDGLVPSETNIDIVAENIPIRDIVELSKNTLNATLQQPEMKQFAALSFVTKLPALLSQAGTILTIKDTHIGNKDIDMKLEGQAKADMNALTSATADATATFRGLDTLITRLKERQKNPGSPADAAKLQASIDKLETVRQYARAEKTPDGQTLHILDFKMMPEGQMLVNGEDISKLKAATAPKQKPAKIPAP